jgi:NTE family protein
LVLGAGGRPGLAYHAGTLLALDLHGLPPSKALSITGTSAGSIATAMLAAGATAEDLSAHSVGASPREQFRAASEIIRAAEARPFRLDLGGLWHAFDVRRTMTAAAHLRARRGMSALAALVPGVLEVARRFDFLDAMAATPDFPDWRIVAVDTRGRRHVLTALNAPLSTAVAASCAIPGLFAAVRHDGRRLVDGGVHSTTNADLAKDDAGDSVIVLAPMGGRSSGGQPIVNLAEATLAHELAILRRAGKRVVTFRPSPALRRLMGRNPLAGAHSREITAAAFIEAADVLADLEPAQGQAQHRRRAAATSPVQLGRSTPRGTRDRPRTNGAIRINGHAHTAGLPSTLCRAALPEAIAEPDGGPPSMAEPA